MSDDSCSGNWFGPFVNVLDVSSKVLVRGGLQMWLLRDEGLPCARRGQVRPVPQQIRHRPQLSPSSQANHGSVKTCFRKVKKWERREQRKRNKRKHQRRGRFSTVKQTHTPFSQRTEAREGRMLEPPCRDDSPQKSWFRAGASHEALWPVGEPTLEPVLQ